LKLFLWIFSLFFLRAPPPHRATPWMYARLLAIALKILWLPVSGFRMRGWKNSANIAVKENRPTDRFFRLDSLHDVHVVINIRYPDRYPVCRDNFSMENTELTRKVSAGAEEGRTYARDILIGDL